MSEPIIIIGVDHGYAAMKTAHFSFHTGLVAHEHEPYTLNNVLEYGGKYYVVGSGRQPLQKDKTQTERRTAEDGICSSRRASIRITRRNQRTIPTFVMTVL